MSDDLPEDHPYNEHERGKKLWEEIRLLESIVDDLEDEPPEEQVETINRFLNEQCEVLSVGHNKCEHSSELYPVLPAYENLKDFEEDRPHVIGCYECGQLYRVDSEGMPEEFEELENAGMIRVGDLDYSRKSPYTISVKRKNNPVVPESRPQGFQTELGDWTNGRNPANRAGS